MIAILLLCAVSGAADGLYRADYSYHEGAGGWFKVHKVPAVWNDARLRCELEGAVLASPVNENVTSALIEFMEEAGLDLECGMFTGTNARFSKGDYYSIEGVPLWRMPVDWMPLEPDNKNNKEECIVMVGNFSIADANCSQTLPYICYKKANESMPINECGTSDNDYKLFPNTCNCYKYHTKPRTWSEAFMTCSAEGGYLAIPNNKDEAIHLSNMFKDNIGKAANTTYTEVMFLGFKDIDINGSWSTIHGSRMSDYYFEWHNGQPEGKNGSTTCGAMYQDGLLDDYFCTNKATFVCEKAVHSLL
ncbi:secretory phospholipase A2 receptor-like [Aricia agestis]|uniref:secretory phospholipase A2 receptor-like n=1 Tax=Aricia agestis TaxID=91739 RepID=UPI001C201A91|nr:secretory phospholipase A2 receptor-like [Aricia agestis]